MRKHILKAMSFAFAALLTVQIGTPTALAASFVTGANSVSQSYRSGMYYENLNAVPITGDGRTDVVAVALSQLGYQEGDTDGQYSGTVSGKNNFTEYNRNFGDYGQGFGGSYYWCASFVSFCLLQARCHSLTKMTDWCRAHKGDSKYIWREISCSQWAQQLRQCGYFKNSISFGGSYVPIYGDLIFFTNGSENATESHIGIVLYSDGNKVYTVEGNTSSGSGVDTNGGGVYAKSYDLNNSRIRGYGVLPYAKAETKEKIDYSGKNPTLGLYAASTNKYVYESINSEKYKWLLPRGSVFEVTEICENGKVKAVCKIDGKTVTGYINNNSDRIIQLSKAEKELSYIEITSKPKKLLYFEGEEFDKNGLEVTAFYSDKSYETVKDYTLSGFDSTAGVKEIIVSYGGKQASFSVSVEEQEIEKIVIEKEPDKTVYIEGEEFSSEGMVVKAYYENGEEKEIFNYTLSGFESTEGIKRISVSYGGKYDSFIVSVKKAEIVKIAVTKKPNKISYIEGEKLSLEGMVVKAYYNNGKEREIFDYTVSGYINEPGTKTITVSYGDKTDEFSVSVRNKSLASLKILSLPSKTQYIEGEDLDLKGLKVAAVYDNGEEKIISKYALSGYNSSVGQKTITVSFEGKTVKFTVNVRKKQLKSISVTKSPNKLSYHIGEELDINGLEVTAYYDNGEQALIKGYTLSGFSSGYEGQIKVTVSYNGKTDFFNVSVFSANVQRLEISSKPYKLVYVEGESLNTRGLEVIAYYKDGTMDAVTDYKIEPYKLVAGKQTITVSYDGISASFTVTVNEKIHTKKVVGYYAPTCTTIGYTGDTVCVDCKSVLKKGKVIPKKEHEYKKLTEKATVSKNGKIKTTCVSCGEVVDIKTVYKIKTVKLSKSSFLYNGKNRQLPSVIVKDSKGNKLTKGKDYKVKYSTSTAKNVGKYKVTVTFKGKYAGKKTLYFSIVPKSTEISKLQNLDNGFKVNWKKQGVQTTGYEIMYSTSKKFTAKTTKTVTANSSETSKAVTGLKSKKKYYVKIRTYKTVNGKKIYSSYSEVLTVKTK